MNPIFVILAFLPGLLVCYAAYRVDKYEHEPFLALGLAYMAGSMATIPSVEIQQVAFLADWPPIADGLKTALLAFFAVALNEEIFKLLALLIVAYPWSYFNEPLDGIVYAVVVAMGFSSIENLSYAHQYGVETAIARVVTAVPAHLVFAIIVGFYVGKAKFMEDKVLRWKKILKGLVYASLFHGFYDFLIMQNWTEWLYLLAVLGLYTALYFSARMIRMRQEESPFKNEEHQTRVL